MDEHSAIVRIQPRGTGRGQSAAATFQTSHLRWSTIFSRFAASLTSLREFRFKSRRWCKSHYRIFGRELYEDMSTALLPERYKAFKTGSWDTCGDRGYGEPVRTISKYDGGETPAGMQYIEFLERVGEGREQDREDEAALRGLLERVYGPVRQPAIMTQLWS